MVITNKAEQQPSGTYRCLIDVGLCPPRTGVHRGQDRLIREIEAILLPLPSPSVTRQGQRPGLVLAPQLGDKTTETRRAPGEGILLETTHETETRDTRRGDGTEDTETLRETRRQCRRHGHD